MPAARVAAMPTIEARARALLARMTVEEKIAQICCIWGQKKMILDAEGRFSPEKMRTHFPHGIGCIARPQDRVGLGDPGTLAPRSVSETVAFVNSVQRYMVDQTRLGIPVLFHEEGLHGYMAKDATVFPQAIALASTWNPSLVERVYAVVAREIRARGVHHVLSPVVDVARDPRWGRIEETFGEDPLLVSRMGVAAVRGFQGDSLPLQPGRVLTTLKHMTGHGEPESGTNVGPAHVSERTLREVFFPPFKAAIQEANAASVMASYNEIDGVPSHVSDFLLRKVLRGEWGFEGLVVSDYFAIDELVTRHGVAAELPDAALMALRAGIDLETPDHVAFPTLVSRLRAGAISEAAVDRAVLNILKAKFQASLFETPYAKASYAEAVTGNQDARKIATEAARQSIVLLKNEEGLLPLNEASLERIAVVGPNANETILGGYPGLPLQAVSIVDGIRELVGNKLSVDFAQGVHITEGRSWWKDEVRFADPSRNQVLIQEAVSVARRADVVVAVVGGNESTSREAWADNHLGDRADLRLLGEQEALIDALVATGKPVVVVLINGRPLAVTDLASRVPALVEGWILGQETGTAVAEVLFGRSNPGGKLPVTIPRSVGHLPAYYNHKPTARRGYVDDSVEPLFPFGYGLSYTRFRFGAPRVEPIIAWGESITVTTQVTNIGSREGDEVVQLYVRDVVSSVTRPVKALVAFERVRLAPGESKSVALTLPFDALAFVGADMEWIVEPGEFRLMVGPNSRDLQTVTVTLEPRPGAAP